MGERTVVDSAIASVNNIFLEIFQIRISPLDNISWLKLFFSGFEGFKWELGRYSAALTFTFDLLFWLSVFFLCSIGSCFTYNMI